MQYDWYIYKKREIWTQIHTEKKTACEDTGRDHRKTEAGIGVTLSQAKDAQRYWKLRRGKEGSSPRACGGSMALLTS